MGHYFDSIAQDNSFRLLRFLLKILKIMTKYYLTRHSIYSVIPSPFYQRPWAALRVIAIIIIIVVLLFLLSSISKSSSLLCPYLRPKRFTLQCICFHSVWLSYGVPTTSCPEFTKLYFTTLNRQKLRLWKSKNENSILLSHTDFMRSRFTGVIWLPPP